MATETTTGLIVQYLTSTRTKQAKIIDELARTPDNALEGALGFCGPYPDSIHPRDVHDTHLVLLMADLLKKCPRLFTERDIRTVDRYRRYPLICAAISTQDPCFTNGILTGLRDRSIYIKQMVVEAVTRYEYLRTPSAKKELERLITVRSIAESDYDRKPVEEALRAFTG